MFTSNNGDRSGYRNVGVVITDGESNDRARTFREAVSNRNKGIEMISVGIGLKVCIRDLVQHHITFIWLWMSRFKYYIMSINISEENQTDHISGI